MVAAVKFYAQKDLQSRLNEISINEGIVQGRLLMSYIYVYF